MTESQLLSIADEERVCAWQLKPSNKNTINEKKSKKHEIEFDVDTLIGRLEGPAAGTQPVKERVIKIPPPVKPISSKEIRTIRLNMGYTQIQFASLLNVPKIRSIVGACPR